MSSLPQWAINEYIYSSSNAMGFSVSWKCKYCTKSFGSWSSAITHEKTHEIIRNQSVKIIHEWWRKIVKRNKASQKIAQIWIKYIKDKKEKQASLKIFNWWKRVVRNVFVFV